MSVSGLNFHNYFNEEHEKLQKAFSEHLDKVKAGRATVDETLLTNFIDILYVIREQNIPAVCLGMNKKSAHEYWQALKVEHLASLIQEVKKLEAEAGETKQVEAGETRQAGA